MTRTWIDMPPVARMIAVREGLANFETDEQIAERLGAPLGAVKTLADIICSLATPPEAGKLAVELSDEVFALLAATAEARRVSPEAAAALLLTAVLYDDDAAHRGDNKEEGDGGYLDR